MVEIKNASILFDRRWVLCFWFLVLPVGVSFRIFIVFGRGKHIVKLELWEKQHNKWNIEYRIVYLCVKMWPWKLINTRRHMVFAWNSGQMMTIMKISRHLKLTMISANFLGDETKLIFVAKRSIDQEKPAKAKAMVDSKWPFWELHLVMTFKKHWKMNALFVFRRRKYNGNV